MLIYNENIKTFTNIFRYIELKAEHLGVQYTIIVVYVGNNKLISLNVKEKKNVVIQLEISS